MTGAAHQGSKEFGTALRSLRVAGGLSQAEVARMVGVTPSAVSMWEAGGAISHLNAFRVDDVLGANGQLVRHLGLSSPRGNRGGRVRSEQRLLELERRVRDLEREVAWLRSRAPLA